MRVRAILSSPLRSSRHAAFAAALAALALPASAAQRSLLEIALGPHETSQLQYREMTVRLDGAAVPVDPPVADAPAALVYAELVAPGPHRIEVEAAFTGKSSMFSYVDGYVFRMKGELDVVAPAGEAVRVDVRVVRKSGLTVAWDDRHHLSMRASTHASERAAAAQAPEPEVAAAPEPAPVAQVPAPEPAPAAVVPAVHVEPATPCVLEPPRFAHARHELDRAGRAALERFAECLARSEDTVVIEGFTDPVGTPAFNEWLSEQRAQAVADHLAARGIARSRLTVRALGASRLVCTDRTPACRSRNRRAEAASVPAR